MKAIDIIAELDKDVPEDKKFGVDHIPHMVASVAQIDYARAMEIIGGADITAEEYKLLKATEIKLEDC